MPGTSCSTGRSLATYLRLILPQVLAPDTFLMGTVIISQEGEPTGFRLDVHRIAESRSLIL